MQQVKNPHPPSGTAHRQPAVSGAAVPDEPAGTGLPVVRSSDLLGDGRAVAIEHNGATYRLQTTKLGKLILTK